MALNLTPIQGRKDFKAHDSFLCSGGENWIVVESKRMAIYFTFYPFFTGKLALQEEREGRGKTQPNFSEERQAVQVLQLDNLQCTRELMTEKDNLFSVFSMFIRDKFLYGCFHLCKYYELT